MYQISSFWFSIKEPMRFLIVGGYNTLFAYILFAILEKILYQQVSYLLVLCLVHFISVVNSFFTLRILVFRSQGKILFEYLRVNYVYLLYLFLNMGMLYTLKSIIGINVLVAQFICVSILSIACYIIHKFFSFNRYV